MAYTPPDKSTIELVMTSDYTPPNKSSIDFVMDVEDGEGGDEIVQPIVFIVT